MTDFNINGWDWPGQHVFRAHDLLLRLTYDDCNEECDHPCKISRELRLEAREYIEQLEAERDRVCVWTRDKNGNYGPDCTSIFRGIKNKFCPYCGGKVVVK